MKNIILSLVLIVAGAICLQAQDVKVGTLNGDLSVSPTGAGVYTINIDLPPGRGGLTPQLALQYNSQGETGVLGKGWGIVGWSFVERVGKTLYHDDNVTEPGSVNFVDDEFSLNGNRLILANQSNSIYRFENDDITRIRYLPLVLPESEDKRSTYYWRVQTKDGWTKEFGGTLQSRQDNGASTQPIRWHLNKVTDMSGNSIEYEYYQSQENGEIYLERILYEPYVVVFDYETLPPEEFSSSYFSHGSSRYLYTVSMMLTGIRILYEEETIKEYRMEFENKGILQSSFLKKVTLFDEGGNSINPTVFNWHYNTHELGEDKISFYQSEFEHYYTLFSNSIGDFNGDGRSDIAESRDIENLTKVFLSDGPQFDILFYGKIDIGDFDGNGVEDIVITRPGQQKKTRIYTLVDDEFVQYGTERDNVEVLFVGDFTGNGLADIITKETGKHYIYPGNTDLSAMLNTSNRKVVDNYPAGIYRSGNFYGNGQLGLLEISGNIVKHHTVVKDGSNYKLKNQIENDFYLIPFTPIRLEVGDFNGDGKDDLITAHYSGSVVKTTIHYGYGSGFKSNSTLTVTQPWWQNKLVVADLNNDGISDLYFHEEEINYSQNKYKYTYTKLFKYSATDKGFKSYTGNFDIPIPENAFDFDQTIPIRTGDFNGNGEQDVLYQYEIFYGDPRDMGSSRRATSYRHVFYIPKFTISDNLIIEITNGLGLNQRITYKPFSPAEYKPRFEYPVLNYRYPFSTVHTIETQIPNSQDYFAPTTYNFTGMQVHALGKGMLGFQTMTVTDGISNTSTTTTNDLLVAYVSDKLYYFFSYPKTVSTQDLTTNRSLSHTETQMDFKNLVTGKPLIFMPVATRVITTTRDNNETNSITNRTVALQNINDIDAYGNSIKSVQRASIWWLSNPNDDWDFNTTVNASYHPPTEDQWVSVPEFIKTTHSSAEDDNNANKLIDKVVFTYYDNKLPETKTVYPSDQNSELVTKETYTYDDYGNILSVTLEAPQNLTLEPRVTSFEYDNTNRFVKEKTIFTNEGDNLVTEYDFYPALGLLKWEKDIRGNQTDYVYDGFGKLTHTYHPDGTSSHSNTDWANNHQYAPEAALFFATNNKEVEHETWHETTRFFDAMGRELRSMAYNLQGDPVLVDMEYDENGRLKTVTEPYYADDGPSLNTSYDYDQLGRLIVAVSPDGSKTETEYDGRTVTTTITATNVWSTKIVNAMGLTDWSKDPTGVINYDYNGKGQLIQVHAQGQYTYFDYDIAGNQNELIDPNAGTTAYTYNAFGELTSQTDANGNTYEMVFDDLGRLKTKTLVSGSSDVTTVEYYTSNTDNGFGLLKRNARNNGTAIDYTYDALGRITGKTETIDQNSFTFAYGYNTSSGMLETYTYPGGFGLLYEYNSLGLMDKVKRADNMELLWKGISQNQRGQYRFAEVGGHTTISWNYDQYGFPWTHEVTKGNGKERTEIMALAYIFDPETGNLSERFDDLRRMNESFTYDTDKLHSRLTGWKVNDQTVASLSYHDNGNITKKSDVSTASNSYNYQHPQGKPHAVTGISSPTAGFAAESYPQSVEFNAFNKVEKIINDDASNYYQLQFLYGPDNQRKRTFLNQITGHPGVPEILKYFIDNYEYEYRNDAYRHIHYLNGPAGLFAIMVKQGSTETMYYVHKDYLGSISAITDATGNLVESLSYDPWGRRRNPNNWTDYNISSTLFDRGFTGHEHLPQFGLINMNGRVYDPFLARFLSPDPFVQAPDYSQNFNRYSYAFNNPLKYTDPDGEWVHLVVGAAIGGIANVAFNWKKIDNFWQGLGYFGIGAGAGALAAGTGAGFGTLAAGSGSFGFMSATGLSAAGFLPGAAAGAGAGFTSGFVTGTGNSLVEGENLKHSLGKGLQSGAWGLAIGGFTGGVFGGYQAHRLGNNIWSGNPTGGRFGNIPELQQFGRLSSNLDPVELNMSNIRRPGMSLVDEMAQPHLKPGIYGKVQGLGEVNSTNTGFTVIGETMARVENYAAKLPNATILNNMPTFTGSTDQITSQMMSYNRNWFLQQMRSGRPIINLGLDLNRTNPSIFYQMEQNMMRNYLRLHPNAFQIITP